MGKSAQVVLALLRIAMGWMMLYAGLTKVFNPKWTAAAYLQNAKTFTGFFQWLASPENIGLVNFINAWGPTFLGISLILGIGIRFSSLLGAILILLYYFPILQFPYPNPHSYVVDDYIIYALVLIFFAAVRAGKYYGLENWCANLPLCRKYPALCNFFG